MADLDQVREFIAKYADLYNEVESLNRVAEELSSGRRTTAELRLYHPGEPKAFFKYEVGLNIAVSYLSSQLTAKQTALAAMDSKLADIVVE